MLRQVVKVRNKAVKRVTYITRVIVFVAVCLFLYTCYKYFFYSGDCLPLNRMSIEVNSLLTMCGLGTDFMFWLAPVVAFFWPSSTFYKEETSYRKAKKRWSTYSTSMASGIQNYSDSNSSSDTSSGDEDKSYEDLAGSDGEQSDSNDRI